MQLFILENNIAKPNIEVLLISPFKDIWERDSTSGREKAIRDFTFIELMCSPRKSNPFFGYAETERASKIIQQVFKGEEYIPDELVLQGMSTYLEYLTQASISFRTLRANKLALEKTNSFFEQLDYSDTNPRSGMPLYKPKEVTTAIKDTYDVLKVINSLEEKVQQELFETSKTKGNRKVNRYEQ